jgi:hypothetical protein
MSDFIDVPFDTDPDDLSAQSYAYVQSQVDGWEPNEGNLERIVIDGQNRISSDTRNILARVPTSIYRYFGQIVGLLPLDAISASSTTTWTMIDTQGYTIPAGTLVGIRTAGDDLVNFQTMYDVVVPSGSMSTNPGEVVISAVDAGLGGSDLGVAGGPVELQDPLAFVDTIVLVSPTTGGQDAEDDPSYLQRLGYHLSLMGHALVVPRDYEAAAKTQPGIARALALDGYDPDLDSFGEERTVGIAMIDAAGQDVSSPVAGPAIAYMQQYREINFVIKQVHPTYTPVDITYDVNILPNAGITDVDINAALSTYLSPQNWGLPADQAAGTEGLTVPPANDWINQSTVYYFEIAQTISDIQGVDRLNSLTIGINGGAQAAGDATLPGVVTLPQPGAMAATVHYET